MKIIRVSDVAGFFEAVGGCAGRVELVTGEGDRLNLKSSLCQYVALAGVLRDAAISDVEIVCSEPEDALRLLRFLVQG